MTSEKMEKDVSKCHVVIGINCTNTHTHTKRSVSVRLWLMDPLIQSLWQESHPVQEEAAVKHFYSSAWRYEAHNKDQSHTPPCFPVYTWTRPKTPFILENWAFAGNIELRSIPGADTWRRFQAAWWGTSERFSPHSAVSAPQWTCSRPPLLTSWQEESALPPPNPDGKQDQPWVIVQPISNVRLWFIEECQQLILPFGAL